MSRKRDGEATSWERDGGTMFRKRDGETMPCVKMKLRSCLVRSIDLYRGRSHLGRCSD